LRSGHYVYLVRCADGTYYCGYALDPVKRIQAHNEGKGSKILRGKLPVHLAFVRRVKTKGDALRFELSLKRRTHAEKRALARRWNGTKRKPTLK
jgi:putative endonuclease